MCGNAFMVSQSTLSFVAFLSSLLFTPEGFAPGLAAKSVVTAASLSITVAAVLTLSSIASNAEVAFVS